MRHILSSALFALTLLFFSSPVIAACSSYPHTLTNGTNADANQVIDNFNCSAKTSGDTLDATTFTGTTMFSGPIIAAGAITPSTTNGIIGTASGNNANAGSVGEYVSSTNSSGTSLTTSVATNITSILLTAGDWDVSGVIDFEGSGASFVNSVASISTTSSTLGTLGQNTQLFSSAVFGAEVLPTPIVRINVSTTTTVYLVGLVTFSPGTAAAKGVIRARRVR